MKSKTIVNRVLETIDNSGKSDYVIKKELGFTNSVISGWRIGRAKPSTDAIIKIAIYFNVSADFLLVLTDDPTPFNRITESVF